MAIPAAAFMAGGTVVSSLLSGILGMKQKEEEMAWKEKQAEEARRFEVEKMRLNAPLQGAQMQGQALGALGQLWGGTRR